MKVRNEDSITGSTAEPFLGEAVFKSPGERGQGSKIIAPAFVASLSGAVAEDDIGGGPFELRRRFLNGAPIWTAQAYSKISPGRSQEHFAKLQEVGSGGLTGWTIVAPSLCSLASFLCGQTCSSLSPLNVSYQRPCPFYR